MRTTDPSPPPTTGATRGRTPAGRRRAVSWVLQAALAVVFAMAGLTKLAGDAAMTTMFADVGAGQWLRVVVGALEVAAAVGLLVPRLVVPAAAGLVLLMAGATVTNVVVLGTGPVVTLVLLVVAGLVVVLRRRRRP